MQLATAAPASAPTTGASRPVEPPRRDIQGLRALAVGLVVLSHFWPGRLPGGYIGVDVFFVISGFLITSHLLTKPPQRWRDLGAFWGRRVRRLLPAASLVLLVSLAASVAFLPATALPRIAHETASAALYVENWALAGSATDYFAADDLHTPVQHYWSLSVEEQFYIVWPLVIGAALWCARRFRSRFPWVEVGLAAVFVASLAYSFADTASKPAQAYFVTPTRMWELALGGLVALVAVRGYRLVPRAGRAPLAWLGIGAIVASALLYDAATPFPGIAALLPTVGAAAVIAAAADDAPWSPDRVWSARGVQLTGDISYSIYLWHWPLIVVTPFVLGHDVYWPVKIALMVVAFLLAWLTKVLVEDPVRRSRGLARPLWRTFLVGALLMGVTVGAATGVRMHEEHVAQQAQDAVASALHADSTCFGAAAAREKACDFVGSKLLTPATYAKTDKAQVYEDDCWNAQPFTSRKTCTYGAKNPTKRIALVGNSHGGYWQPALADIATRNGWQVTTYLASQCYPADAVQLIGPASDGENCRKLARWQISSIASGHYDLVVASNRTWLQLKGVAAADRGDVARGLFAKTLKTWTDAGVPALVIRDVPFHQKPVPDCVAENPTDLAACADPEKTALVRDPLFEAARGDRSGMVSTLDLTPRFCKDGTCYGVVGGVIAYFDQGHMSATFSRTLEADVEAPLARALGE
ncbi:acyltransferase family protein [Luteimicrobium sp. NPDC057192]|uniref:acyltransferase family protein n=1 Tax=Luteimicrobium sp. NPDC057192 TaxID=3346042 RepID=UPI003640F689